MNCNNRHFDILNVAMMMLRFKDCGFLQGVKGKEGQGGLPGSEGLKVPVISKLYVLVSVINCIICHVG